MIKRILLFVFTNIAVLLVLSVVAQLLGVNAYLAAHGESLTGLLVWASLFGFGGAFVSLAMSKMQAKMFMGVQVIAPQSADANAQWLLSVVEHHARNVGVRMPEVGIFDSPEPNAFATGMSRNSSLVAVSTGLMQRMSRQEIEAVLGHEMTHVANGDMVTLALIQGVLNTFVMFLARIIGGLIDGAFSGNRDDDRGGGIGYFLIVMLLQTVLGVLATLIVMWFSRWREFRADAGGAQLGGRQNMISALQALSGHNDSTLPKAFQAFGISGEQGVSRLFMSHPPVEERIAALRAIS